MAQINYTLTPVRQRRLRGFSAPDPWRKGASQRWDLSLLRAVIESAAAQAEWAAIRPGKPIPPDPRGDPVPGGRPLGTDEAIGFERVDGGTLQVLPLALQDAWWEGEVADTRLPDILAALQPTLRSRDFYARRRMAGCRNAAVLMVGVAVAIAVAAWFLLPPQEHVMHSMTTDAFLLQPAAEGYALLAGGLPVTAIAPIDTASLRPPADLQLPAGLDTIGWFAAADGGRRLIIYISHGSPQLRPDLLAYGPVLHPQRIGLDATRAAAEAHADPAYVMVQRATWTDSADPTGLGHMPWAVPAVSGFFALVAAAFLVTIAFMRQRYRTLRRRVADLMQARTAPAPQKAAPG